MRPVLTLTIVSDMPGMAVSVESIKAEPDDALNAIRDLLVLPPDTPSAAIGRNAPEKVQERLIEQTARHCSMTVTREVGAVL